MPILLHCHLNTIISIEHFYLFLLLPLLSITHFVSRVFTVTVWSPTVDKHVNRGSRLAILNLQVFVGAAVQPGLVGGGVGDGQSGAEESRATAVGGRQTTAGVRSAPRQVLPTAGRAMETEINQLFMSLSYRQSILKTEK